LVAAEAALSDRATMRKYVKEVTQLRSWFVAELERLQVRTYPSAGNFLLANFGTAGPPLFRRLERQGILLRDRSKDIRPGFVRITIGTSAEMRRLLKAIRNARKVPA
jgi:histidinol-phosphate aminotransferase